MLQMFLSKLCWLILIPTLWRINKVFSLFHSNDNMGLCVSFSDHFYHGCQFGVAVDILHSDGAKALPVLAIYSKRNNSQGHSIFTYRGTGNRDRRRAFNLEGKMFSYQKCSTDHRFHNQCMDCGISDHPIRHHNDSVPERTVSTSRPLSVLHLRFPVRRIVRQIIFDRFLVSHAEPSSEVNHTQNMVSCPSRDRNFSFLFACGLVPLFKWRFNSFNSRLHRWSDNWHYVCEYVSDLFRNRGAEVQRVCSGVRFCCDWRWGDYRWLVRVADRTLVASALFKCGS